MMDSPQKYNSVLKWFVLLTRSRVEKKVAEHLTACNILVYLPLNAKKSHWSDRTKNIEQPLISFVIFVHSLEQQLPHILETAGLVRIMKYLNKPAIVQEYEIENIKIMLQQATHFESIAPLNLAERELIKVSSGQFKGLQATYIVHALKYKVIVVLKALRTFFEVEVANNDIKKISVAV